MSWREHSCHAYIIGGIGILTLAIFAFFVPSTLDQNAKYQAYDDDQKAKIKYIVYGLMVIPLSLYLLLIIGTYKVS